MRRRHAHRFRSVWAAATVVATSVLVPVLAAAGTGPSTSSLAAHTSCPTDYSGDTFPCSTSTSSPSTVPPSQVSLDAHYSGGKLFVKACGFTRAANGHTAQLYVNGSPISAGEGGVATVGGSGCASFTASVCLRQGTYRLAVVDQTPVPGGTAEVTGTVSVSSAKACRAAAVAASGQSANGFSGGSSGQQGAGFAGAAGGGAPVSHHSGLAFTGSYVARAVLLGAILLLAGYALVHRSRGQKRRRRYRYTRLR